MNFTQFPVQDRRNSPRKWCSATITITIRVIHKRRHQSGEGATGSGGEVSNCVQLHFSSNYAMKKFVVREFSQYSEHA